MKQSNGLRKKEINILDVRLDTKNSLRKADLFRKTNGGKIKFETLSENPYKIKKSSLTISDSNILQFKIDDTSLQDSLIKLKYLLTNTDINLVKFGLRSVRKYLSKKAEDAHTFYIDHLLSVGVVGLFKSILRTTAKDNQINFEILWTLINLTFYGTNQEKQFEYYSLLVDSDFIAIYDSLLNNDYTPNEILNVLYQMLFNITFEDKDVRKVIKATDFIGNSIQLVGKGKVNHIVLECIYQFMSNMTKDYESMTQNECEYYFNFFIAPIRINEELNANKMVKCSIFALYNLSFNHSPEFLNKYLSFDILSKYLSFLNTITEYYEEENNVYILKTITNMSDNLNIVKYLVEKGIIDVYKKLINALNKENNSSQNVHVILNEILITMGNILCLDDQIELEKFMSDDFMDSIVKLCDVPMFRVRKSAIGVLNNLFSFPAKEVLKEANKVIPIIVNHITCEIKEEIINLLVNISCNIIINEKKLYQTSGAKSMLINSGIEDIIDKIELASFKEIDKLRALLYSS